MFSLDLYLFCFLILALKKKILDLFSHIIVSNANMWLKIYNWLESLSLKWEWKLMNEEENLY